MTTQFSKSLFALLSAGLLAMTAWAATTPVIFSITMTSTQITITGTNFSPFGSIPSVALDNISLVVVSYNNTVIVANLPVGLLAGTYRLTLTNSSGLAVALDMSV